MRKGLNMKVIYFVAVILFFSSCATIKGFFNSNSDEVPPVVVAPLSAAPVADATEQKKTDEPEQEPLTKYSDNANMAPATDREYKRMTRQRMEDESDLQSGAGSLWVMEGQTSYLFAQNKQRRAGDPTQIKIEGSALKQIEMKVGTIQDLLKELEEQKKAADEIEKKAADAKQRLADIETEKQHILANGEARSDSIAQAMAEERIKNRAPAAIENDKVADKNKKAPAEVAKKPEKEEKIDLKDIQFIPSKIVEKTPDGMFRVVGQQYLNIKKRPYKVIATGLVRPEDFDDQALSSNKIFESQYDIIHMKKTETK
jgi:flagellar L-ring protein FlgH